jgi:hypothetical protein
LDEKGQRYSTLLGCSPLEIIEIFFFLSCPGIQAWVMCTVWIPGMSTGYGYCIGTVLILLYLVLVGEFLGSETPYWCFWGVKLLTG